jgi:metal-responsive CopG/Arc/MetJ family transcriptional regulator
MPIKGRKSTKGVGDLYESPKTRISLMVTEEALQSLDQMANELGISRSELVERFGRKTIKLPHQEEPLKKSKRSQKLPSTG